MEAVGAREGYTILNLFTEKSEAEGQKAGIEGEYFLWELHNSSQ
jgi:hypothetical protein